jgi:hypothetical protein
LGVLLECVRDPRRTEGAGKENEEPARIGG